MIRLFLSVLLACAVASPTVAQAPTRSLVVMNLAAHPDDEDGSTLAYYRGHVDAAAFSVIYTRGEGGQNEAGPDLYERLGAVRTNETEAAARILGTRVTYLNFYDFGFSKHGSEAFDEWSRPRRGFWDLSVAPVGEAAGRDTVTARLVQVIRTFKPDVLFTNHDTSTAWPNAQHGQHQAVGISAMAAFDLAADPSYHPEQLTQPGVDLWQPKRLFLRVGGFGGEASEYDVAIPVDSPCAPVNRSPAESCADRAVRAAAEHISQGFDKFASRFRRETTRFVLMKSAQGVASLPEGATDLGAGLEPNPFAAELSVSTMVETGRSPASADPLLVSGITIRGRGVPEDADFTVPKHRFMYDRLHDAPSFRYTMASDGEITRNPLDVAPPVVLDLQPSPILLHPGRNEIPVAVTIHNPELTVPPRVQVVVRDAAGSTVAFTTLTAAPDEPGLIADVALPASLAPGRYEVVVNELRTGGCSDDCERVQRPAAVLPDVSVSPGLRVGFVRSFDGTMASAMAEMGAEVVELDSTALAEARFDGLHTIVIDIRAYLDRTDLVAHNDNLLAWVATGGHLVVGYQKSFEWNEGGTNPQTSATNGAYGPYPLTLGRDRVTMEDVPVAITQAEHLVFNAPHQINVSDWDGWVQERGLYFPSDWDDRYATLLSMSDRGEDPLQGGLLIAKVGTGTYAYSPLVWYRQLEALNAGAWRLFANLVSLPLTDGRAAP